jgi:hypothetical protein
MAAIEVATSKQAEMVAMAADRIIPFIERSPG